MKRLFISQPMRGKTEEEILAVRNKAIESAEKILCEKVVVLPPTLKTLLPMAMSPCITWASLSCYSHLLMWHTLPRAGKKREAAASRIHVLSNTVSP